MTPRKGCESVIRLPPGPSPYSRQMTRLYLQMPNNSKRGNFLSLSVSPSLRLSPCLRSTRLGFKDLPFGHQPATHVLNLDNHKLISFSMRSLGGRFLCGVSQGLPHAKMKTGCLHQRSSSGTGGASESSERVSSHFGNTYRAITTAIRLMFCGERDYESGD
jgi:hypothetical protein